MPHDRPHGRGGLTLACRLLPPAVRADIRALYRVFRTLDDLVDDGDPAAAAAVAAVERWAADGRVTTDLTAALADVARRRDLPRHALRDFCAGMRHDLEGRPIVTEDDLDRYCYRVAGTVGIVVAAVLGADGPWEHDAAALGVALQRTNILRDVEEDRRAGRAYLPRETLARHDGDWRGLAAEEVARADGWYDAGLPGIARLRRGRLAVLAAAVTYREILRAIERDPDAARTARTVVPGRRKLLAVLRALTAPSNAARASRRRRARPPARPATRSRAR